MPIYRCAAEAAQVALAAKFVPFPEIRDARDDG
jgi:hypothetical protein